MQFLYSHTLAVISALKDISKKYRQYKNFCDLGCGSGYRTMQFHEYGRKVSGIDMHDYRLPEYRTKDFHFIHADMFKNKLPDNSFDMIMSFDVIEHLEEPEKLLQEIHRLLAPGGICVLSTPNRYRILNAILLLLGKRKYPYCISEDDDAYPEYWHITEFTDGQIRAMARSNKFDFIEHYKIYYGMSGGVGFKTFLGFPFYHNHIHILKKKK